MILAGKGDLLISKPKSDQKAKNNCYSLCFCVKSCKVVRVNRLVMVSPLTTTAVLVSHVDQLFMMALKKRMKSSMVLRICVETS